MRMYFDGKKHAGFLIVSLVILIIILFSFLYFGKQISSFLSRSLYKPGNCLFFQEKNCSKVTFIKNPDNEEEIAAFSLPSGARLFSPIDGCYTDESNSTIQGKSYPGVLIFQSADCNFQNATVVYSIVGFLDKKISVGGIIKKGQLIGSVSADNIEALGSYNLALSKIEYVKNGAEVNYNNAIEKIKELFNEKALIND